MNAKDVLKYTLDLNYNVMTGYLSDLSDADLLVRPVPEANHIAWQLGHLIVAEATAFLKQIPGAEIPELPAGFAEQHSKEMARNDSAAGFRTKEEYLGLFRKVREATKAALARLSETDLDKPTSGPMAKFAPTVGAMLALTANHVMMHAGQFTVVRRKLGKPVVF
jgi:uncharacterized damage-inducible protein DinB